MMNIKEYLFVKLTEECNELSQRCSKIIRFGLNEKQDGQEYNNEERFYSEFMDLLATFELLKDKNIIGDTPQPFSYLIEMRKERFQKYYEYSKSLGLVE